MHENKSDLLNEIARYYSEKLALYGDTARGVDWNGEDGQIIRFEQLCKVIDSKASEVSFNDIGCGYGALYNFLHDRHPMFTYLGVDVSEEMTQIAKLRHSKFSNARFITASEPDVIADYGLASGIFNVRLNSNDSDWYDYLIAMLDSLYRTSRLGFAFNCLSSYSDDDKKRDYLYYADPCRLFDHCKRQYSRNVSLFHDYGLYEFTILVRKTL